MMATGEITHGSPEPVREILFSEDYITYDTFDHDPRTVVGTQRSYLDGHDIVIENEEYGLFAGLRHLHEYEDSAEGEQTTFDNVSCIKRTTTRRVPFRVHTFAQMSEKKSFYQTIKHEFGRVTGSITKQVGGSPSLSIDDYVMIREGKEHRSDLGYGGHHEREVTALVHDLSLL